MPDFLVEPTASMTLGNTCATCQTHKHERGFVNLGIDRHGSVGPPSGRLYVCAGCADQIGRAVGCLDPVQAQELRDAALQAGELVMAMSAELEAQAANRVVPLADVIDLVAAQQKKQAETPAKASA